jgi:drug/metabolite transporter (DMT)-like permease
MHSRSLTVSKPSARKPTVLASGYETSIPRTATAVLLVVLGIVWIAVYTNYAKDAAEFQPVPGLKKPDNPLPWMADLGRWNYLIGFGLVFLGLTVSAHKSTPLGRGRGVVIGMLGCFLIGLIWIVTFYFVSQSGNVPVMQELEQYNLLVGIGFMAVGFTFATKWE